MKFFHGEKLFKMETAWRYLMVKKCVKWKPHEDTSRRKTFLRDNFETWASNGKSIEEIWYNFKKIYESIEQFVPHKKIRKKTRISSITTKR
jgi:hypothetical protein